MSTSMGAATPQSDQYANPNVLTQLGEAQPPERMYTCRLDGCDVQFAQPRRRKGGTAVIKYFCCTPHRIKFFWQQKLKAVQELEEKVRVLTEENEQLSNELSKLRKTNARKQIS